MNITFTADEAIVLFEFLARFNKQKIDGDESLFEDQAEQKVLWLVEGKLEKILAEPFRADYSQLLKEARNKLRDEE